LPAYFDRLTAAENGVERPGGAKRFRTGGIPARAGEAIVFATAGYGFGAQAGARRHTGFRPARRFRDRREGQRCTRLRSANGWRNPARRARRMANRLHVLRRNGTADLRLGEGRLVVVRRRLGRLQRMTPDPTVKVDSVGRAGLERATKVDCRLVYGIRRRT